MFEYTTAQHHTCLDRGLTVEALLVCLCETLLALQNALVDGNDRWVVFAGVVDRLWVAKRRVGVEEVVAASGKGDPFRVGLQTTHLRAEAEPRVLHLRGHTAAPLVEGLPRTLDGAHDAFLKVCAVLLHDDDALLQSIFLVDLAL